MLLSSSSSTSARVIKLLCVLYLLEISVLVRGTQSSSKHRTRRIVDKSPTTTTVGPLTSEEHLERISGTESPHLFDYPDEIYLSQVVREGEWVKKPIPQKNTKNVTITTKIVVKGKKTKNGDSSVEMAIASLFKELGNIIDIHSLVNNNATNATITVLKTL